MKRAPSHVIAGCFSLCAFSIAVITGLAAENGALTILLRAILAMFACYVVGLIIGWACDCAIRSHVAALDEAAESEGNVDDGAASVAPPEREDAEQAMVI